MEEAEERMAGSTQPQAQSQGGEGGAPAGTLSGTWQLGMGEPTGTGWVVACLLSMRVTVYFLISTLPIPQLHVPSQRAHSRNLG